MVNINPERVAFSYRILGGVTTIFIFDNYLMNTRIQPDSTANLAVSFIAPGKSLRQTRERFSRDSALILDAVDIGAITVRNAPLNYRDVEATHTRYTFNPVGDLFSRVSQTYDAFDGKLIKEVQEAPEGYSLIRNYSYESRSWVYYDNAGQPFFVPSAVETYIQVG